MNARRYQQLLKRAARISRLQLEGYDATLDEAVNEATDDAQWERFAADLEQAEAVPLTPREQKMVANRKAREELERARLDALHTEQHYQHLLRQRGRR